MAEVELTIEGNTARLTIDRPDALNALSASVLDALEAHVTMIESDREIHGVIVTGAGRAFVAGADIAELSRLDPAAGLEFARRGQGVFSRIEALEKPIVAAINGFALGGGCELAMACHLRIASEGARFGQPEVKLGLIPGFGGTQRLARLVGRGIAQQLVLSGGLIGAQDALRVGLVNEVVPPEQLMDRAGEVLNEILANGPRAVAAALRAIREGLDLPLGRGLEIEANLFSELCGTAEATEGTRAFLEKREPKFR